MASLAVCTAAAGTVTGIIRQASSNCKKAGGLKAIYVASESDIDKTATSAFYSDTTCQLSQIAMVGAGKFVEIQTDGGETTFTSEKQDNGNYLNTVTMFFKGTSCARLCAIKQLDNVCPKVVFVQFADCSQFISFEANGTNIVSSLESPDITGDSMTAGTVEGDASSQTLTMTWLSSQSMLCANMTTIPT
jgi:hypothetical protein